VSGDPRGSGGPAGLGVAAQHDGVLLRRLLIRVDAAQPDDPRTRHRGVLRGGAHHDGRCGPGVTCGGNLTVLASSLGTDTSWPAARHLAGRGRSEDDYRIDACSPSSAARLPGRASRASSPDRSSTAASRTTSQPSWTNGWAPRCSMISWADVATAARTRPTRSGVAAELDADARMLRAARPATRPHHLEGVRAGAPHSAAKPGHLRGSDGLPNGGCVLCDHRFRAAP